MEAHCLRVVGYPERDLETLCRGIDNVIEDTTHIFAILQFFNEFNRLYDPPTTLFVQTPAFSNEFACQKLISFLPHIENFNEPHLAGFALQTIAILVRLKANNEVFRSAAILPAICRILQKYALNHIACHQGLRVLDCLCMTTEDRALVVEQDGIDMALTALRCFPHEAGVVEGSCDMLFNLATEARFQDAVMEAKALPAVFRAMRVSGSASHKASEAACRFIQFVAQVPEHRMQIREAGGVSLISTLFQEHMNHPSFCDPAAWVMHRLAQDAAGRGALIDEDCVELLVRAIRRHTASARISQTCCRVLSNLSFDDKHSECGPLVRQADGIAAVAEVYRAHCTDSKICEAVCRVFENLAMDDSACRAAIRDQGVIPLFIETLQTHHDKPCVCEHCLLALANMCHQPQSSLEQLVEQGAVDLAVAAMREHPQHEGVAHGGCRALWRLMSHPEIRETRVREAGAIPLLINALRDHPQHIGICIGGCSALYRLSSCAANHEHIREGGIRAIIAAMRSLSPPEQQVCSNGVEALSSLAHDPENRRIILSNGGMNVFPLAFRFYARVTSFCKKALQALNLLIEEDEGKQLFLEQNLVEWMSCLLNHYVENIPICETILRLLLQLAPLAKMQIVSTGGLTALHELQRVHSKKKPEAKALLELAKLLTKQISRG
eukprot:gnl/Trimastix_PCT/2691.p1 GENE.gnl/Trimastix_PCT/2691~~gnl/Trimastix_PCT/2691.p1  ORF type:complete len:667 (+),score=265.07 gnl/Trimastix_PCT/2691:51-2051(+)